MREVPINLAFALKCRDAAKQQELWVQSPEAVALALIGVLDPGETGNRRTITVRFDGPTNAIITVYTEGVPDDSVWDIFDEIRLQCQGNCWIPVQHRQSQKGRGDKAWTAGNTQ